MATQKNNYRFSKNTTNKVNKSKNSKKGEQPKKEKMGNPVLVGLVNRILSIEKISDRSKEHASQLELNIKNLISKIQDELERFPINPLPKVISRIFDQYKKVSKPEPKVKMYRTTTPSGGNARVLINDTEATAMNQKIPSPLKVQVRVARHDICVRLRQLPFLPRQHNPQTRV